MRPLAQMAAQAVRAAMQDDAAYRRQVQRSPIVVRQVMQAVQKAREDNLQLVKAVVKLLREERCIIILSFPRSHVVECTAELQDDGHLVFHTEARHKDDTLVQSSFWSENEFVRDTIDTIVRRQSPTTVEVQRCPRLFLLGRVPPPEFVRGVVEEFGPLPRCRQWDRLYTEACIRAPR